MNNILREGAASYGVHLTVDMIRSLERYYSLVLDWNSRMNLVSSGDLSRFIEYHILDSLKAASVFDFSSVRSMLDFGSGAGLPGIPLAVAYPHLRTVLLDSREKRCRFLDTAIHDIPVLNASVLRSRVEELDSGFDQTFEIVITRATVSLSDYYRLCSRLVSPNGTLVSIKGDAVDDEFRELENTVDTRVFHIRRVTPVTFPGVRTGQIVLIKRKQVIHN